MRRRLLHDERGVALLIVVFVSAILLVLAVTLVDTLRSESDRSVHSSYRAGAFEAAEAGVDDYIAKLIDDRSYYLHYVHDGESTRREAGGTDVNAGSNWQYGLVWTYPSGKNAWRQLGNGYEYNLQITPPSATSKLVGIIATGRPVGSASTGDWRVLEAKIRPSSVADYYRMVDGDVGFGSTTSTYGQVYAKGTISHSGTAYDNLYSEESITGNPTMVNGAKKYDSSTIRSQIKTPINFSAFLASVADIERAADTGGVYLDDPSVNVWRIVFQPNGNLLIRKCSKNNGQDIAAANPSCGSTDTTYAMPSNGAIYVAQPVLVWGQINGRATVASASEVVIGGDISYVQSGDDVLGLIAVDDVVIAQYAPNNLTWRAGVIAQSGTWKTYSQDGSHSTMNFTGSSATADGGSMTMFSTRNYSYDSTLQYLPPPWFPTLEDAYTVLFFRELPPA
jgi:hypothetical protein